MKKSICVIVCCCFTLLEVSGNELISKAGINIDNTAFLKEQQSILSEHGEKLDIENIVLLNELTNNSIIVTGDSLKSLKENTESALIKLDMYDGANLPILMRKSLDYVFSGKDPSLKGLLSKIESNKKLHTMLINLREALSNQEKYACIDFENEGYSKVYANVLTLLSSAIKTAEVDDAFIKNNTYFLDFLKLSKKFTELAFVRYNTEKMLSKIRTSLEGIQGVTSSNSASLSINVPVPVPGMSANLDLFTTGNSYGSTGLSFYTVTKTKGAKAGITFNILPAKISGKITIEDAAVTLFYSLEAYMDFLNSSSISDLNRLQAKIQGMDSALKDRKGLQAKEKEALANNGMFERYLRLFHALPQTGASLEWVDITKSKALDKANEFAVGTEVSANVAVPLSNLGITLKASKGIKKYTKGTPLLYMINDDCSVIDGMGIENLEELIESKNDLSRAINDSNLLLGLLQSYTFALERLAAAVSSSEKKEYEKRKHSCEKLLLPKGSVGREGVLKAAILTAAILRKEVSNDQQNLIKRFKKIYVQLCNLSKLCEFSKNKSGIRKLVGYGTKAVTDSNVEASVNNLQASFAAQAPQIGNITATAIRKTVNGSPLLEENGKYITLKFSLPVYSTGVIGMAILREKFKSVFAAAANKKIPFNLDDFTAVSKAFGVTKGVNIAASALTSVGMPIGVSASGSSDFTFVWRYVEPLKDTSGIMPLPGQKLLTNPRGCWALDFIVVSSALNGAVNASGSTIDLPIAMKLSASIGKLAKRTGPDTLHDLLSKVNALSLGIVDSKSGKSTAVSSLLNGQSGQILKIFRGIAKMNSNAAFELQMLYNSLLENSKTNGEKEEIEQLFADFINACKNIAPAADEETQLDSGEAEVAELVGGEEANNEDSLNMEKYNTAFNLFKKILDKQHILVFKPYYEDTFARKIDNKSAENAAFQGIRAEAR